MKAKLNSESASHSLALNLLSSRLLAQAIKNKVHRIIFFSDILYGCETWSFALKEHRLRFFQSSVVRKIFGAKYEKVILYSKNLHKWDFDDLTPHQIINV
jgi:hypothetical protein